MQIQSLNGQWQLSRVGSNRAITATVPGDVHTAMLQAEQLKDPMYRDNEKEQMWIGETDWQYQQSFTVDDTILEREVVNLRCHGLDTLATITLNGSEIAKTDNMFRTYEFDVKSHLQVGENTIVITLDAPATYARKMDAERGELAAWVEPMRYNSGAWIRKEPCNFGWDWGPMTTTSGIWRDIELVAYDTARLDNVQILQDHEGGQVRLTVNVEAEIQSADHLSARIELELDGKVFMTTEGSLNDSSLAQKITITNPKLWWVSGMGEQSLYTVRVTLLDGETELDTIEKRIGLRTLSLVTREDEWGQSFEFACNGVSFFAKGANWIPATPYPGDFRTFDYRPTLQSSVDAHMNMIRVWGGGIYEDDHFYEICDELGLAVWQDFIFACGTYPSYDDDFMKNVEAEARDNIKRLRHHACIAVWCGNNEIEQGMPSDEWKASMSWEDYGLLFDELLPSLVNELDPQASYWPGSPHSPTGEREFWENQTCGDTHLWAVWHGKEPFEWYRGRQDRFCSEFGFQSFPEPSTINEVTIPADRNITSHVMEHFQRSAIGNSTIIHYMLDWFQLPTSFDSMVWLSQILQGMAMKYAIEHWRRNMPRTMGTLYWQLNDMWMGPSWSSLDWKGNWKALHHMARRFFAPLMISGVENIDAQTVEVFVTSDLQIETAGIAKWTVSDLQGNTLTQGKESVIIEERTSKQVITLNVAEQVKSHGVRDILIWLELEIDGDIVSDNLVLMNRPKHFYLIPPNIHVTTASDGDIHSVTLRSNVPALYVWLENPDSKFSDNFFHLQAGKDVTVQVTSKDTSGLVVKSLTDTFA
jgi:beta-mannosidase